MNYLRRTAAPWVSFSILAGGLVSTLILFFLARVERSIERLDVSSDEEYIFSRLEQRSH